jgi:hypothetical protein
VQVVLTAVVSLQLVGGLKCVRVPETVPSRGLAKHGVLGRDGEGGMAAFRGRAGSAGHMGFGEMPQRHASPPRSQSPQHGGATTRWGRDQ